jgi:hypothetical protein
MPPADDSDGAVFDLPDVAAPQIGDPPNAAELEDLQTLADQRGVSLQEVVDRYGWNDNFALAVGEIRRVASAAFTGAEIVDATHAWVAFSGAVPSQARQIVDEFTTHFPRVSIEVRTGSGFTEVELERYV